MLSYGVLRGEREAQFRRLAPRLMAVALVQDQVVPAYEVVNTLQGAGRDIPVRVEVLDLPYRTSTRTPSRPWSPSGRRWTRRSSGCSAWWRIFSTASQVDRINQVVAQSLGRTGGAAVP